MHPPSALPAAPTRPQSVAPNRRRGARHAQVVAIPGRFAPESAYNLAGCAAQAPAVATTRR